MKTYMTVLFAGALLASVAFASDADPNREQRFAAKTGRYALVNQTMQEAAAQRISTHSMQCMDQTCCRHMHNTSHSTAAANAVRKEQWFQAKWGRSFAAGASGQMAMTAACDRPVAATNPQSHSDLLATARWGRVVQPAATLPTVHAVRPNCCD
jgi:hypothetical protein